MCTPKKNNFMAIIFIIIVTHCTNRYDCYLQETESPFSSRKPHVRGPFFPPPLCLYHLLLHLLKRRHMPPLDHFTPGLTGNRRRRFLFFNFFNCCCNFIIYHLLYTCGVLGRRETHLFPRATTSRFESST